MKTSICMLLLCLYSGAWAQKSAALRITQLDGDYYVYTTYKAVNGKPFPTNGMYVITPQGAVLIDAPWDRDQVGPLLDSIEQKHHCKAIACIATHFHNDRTGSFDLLQQRGVSTWSSRDTRDLCAAKKEPQAQFVFTQDTVFNFGKHPIQTYFPGEGHTSDNIVIWFADARILYGGCLVKSAEAKDLGNIEDANMSQWAMSIRVLKLRFPDRQLVIPGHQDWKNQSALEHTEKLLAAYEAKPKK